MNIPEITTSVSSVRIVDSNLLHWVYSRDAVVTLTEAEEEVARIGALVEENALESTRLPIDIRPLRSIDRAASKLFASDEVHDRYGVAALGLLIQDQQRHRQLLHEGAPPEAPNPPVHRRRQCQAVAR